MDERGLRTVNLLREIDQLSEEIFVKAAEVACGDGDMLTPLGAIRAHADLIRYRIEVFLSGHDCKLCGGTGRRGIMNQIICNHGLPMQPKETTT